MARYECEEDGSSKFWEVELAGVELTTRWGKIGTAGQSKVKPFANEAAARKEHDKLVAEKTGKGYKRVDGGAELTPSAPMASSAPAPKPPKAGKVVASPYAAIVEKYRAFIKAIEEAGFEVEATFGEPASDAAITAAEAARGKAFPRALRELLKVADGIAISADLGDEVLQRNVLSTQRHIALGDYKGSYWFEGEDEDAPVRHYLIIDEPQSEFSYGYLLRGEVGDDPHVHYHYLHESMEPRADRLASYLERALGEDRVRLAEAIADRDAPPRPALDPNDPHLIVRRNFASIDYQDPRPDGTIGFSNVVFLPAGTPSIGTRALLVMAFEHLSFRDIPSDADFAPLAEMASLRELSLVFGDSDALPTPLAQLAPGTFKTIKKLSLELHHFDSFGFLAAFEGLEELRLTFRRGAIPSDLRAAHGLRKLDFRPYGLDGSAIAVPTTLTVPASLRALSLGHFRVKAMPALVGAEALTHLELGNNEIARIEHLDALTSLTFLGMNDNMLTSLAGLAAQTQLTQLSVRGNLLTSIAGIEHMARLEFLGLNDNSFVTLSALALPSLSRLTLANNKLTDLPSFVGTPALSDLDLRSNKLAKKHAWLDSVPTRCSVDLGSNGIATALKTTLKTQYGNGPKLSL